MRLTLRRESLAWVLLATGLGITACSKSPSAPASPEPPQVPARTHTTLTGALCTTATLPSWLTCTEPFERTHTINVGRSGTLRLNVDYQYVGDYYPNSLSLDVRCGDAVVLERRFGKGGGDPRTYVFPGGTSGPFDVTLPQACQYEIRLFNFIADTKGGHQTTYKVEVDHPQ